MPLLILSIILKTSIDEIIKDISGPDFPTEASLMEKQVFMKLTKLEGG